MEALAARIEALIAEDVGRNIAPLAEAARGGLFGAAASLAGASAPHVGILTGFYIPGGDPPAAETDGPPGAALLAKALTDLGIPVRFLTDPSCRRGCAAALRAAGVGNVPIDTSGPQAAIETWRSAGVTHALAIERPGRTADGTLRNMRGMDIGAFCRPLDDVFLAGPWRTIAVGDGGNEVGMGALPAGLIAEHVALGAKIACTTAAEFPIVAGVSHWGAYALLGMLGALRPDWLGAILPVLEPDFDRMVVERMVADGPAVDGVTLRHEPTIDGLTMSVHTAKSLAIQAAAGLSPP